MSRRSVGSSISPPPSYHTTDELCGEASRPTRRRSPSCGDMDDDGQPTSFRGHAFVDQDARVSERRGDPDQRRRRSHRSQEAPRKTELVKFAFEVLKSNTTIFRKATRDRPFASLQRKVDGSRPHHHARYDVHHHWHISNPTSHTQGAPEIPHDRSVPSDRGCKGFWSRPVPGGNGLDSKPRRQSWSALDLLGDDHQAIFDRLCAACKSALREQLDGAPVSRAFLGPTLYRHECSRPLLPQHCASRLCPRPVEGEEFGSRPVGQASISSSTDTSNFGEMPSLSPSGGSDFLPDRVFFDQPRPCGQEVANWRGAMPLTGNVLKYPEAALEEYNARWRYLSTVQHPSSHEIPWPPIRAGMPFDYMKCDTFAFFARGCGLDPQRSKAPKLDFQLCARNPYLSYDHRLQDHERTRLKAFKRQMQWEKLRWHEDKLWKKFPRLVGPEVDERRKAVWAAIAEGSAICEKRLSNMF